MTRHVHVEHVMGTAVSFDVRDLDPDPSAVAGACAWLHEVDATFSTYRPDSLICRIDRGELLLGQAGPDVDHVLTTCAVLHEQTGGAFDVRAAGHLDPSGYVKGWAIHRAAELLTEAGIANFQINGGGDIVVRGDADAPGAGWRIGIRHPGLPDRLAAVAILHDQAIATSADYERPGHVMAAPSSGLRSVTVVGPDLGIADAWATALYARQDTAGRDLPAGSELQVLLVGETTLRMTPGFPAAGEPRSAAVSA